MGLSWTEEDYINRTVTFLFRLIVCVCKKNTHRIKSRLEIHNIVRKQFFFEIFIGKENEQMVQKEEALDDLKESEGYRKEDTILLECLKISNSNQ